MSAKAAAPPILPPRQSYADVTDQLASIPLHFPSRRRWLIALFFSSLLLGLLFVAATVLFTTGVGIWGLNIPVNWAFAIHNYVWWLGIGHAGTLISALLLLLGRDWRNSLNRFAETMTLVRGRLCRHVSDSASRAALVRLLDVSLSGDHESLAAISQPARMGRLGSAHLSHCFHRLLVHRLSPRSRSGA